MHAKRFESFQRQPSLSTSESTYVYVLNSHAMPIEFEWLQYDTLQTYGTWIVVWLETSCMLLG